MKSPGEYLVLHTDSCVRCSVCDWCPIGRALFDAAVQRCKDMYEPPPLPPIPPIPRSPFKA